MAALVPLDPFTVAGNPVAREEALPTTTVLPAVVPMVGLALVKMRLAEYELALAPV